VVVVVGGVEQSSSKESYWSAHRHIDARARLHLLLDHELIGDFVVCRDALFFDLFAHFHRKVPEPFAALFGLIIIAPSFNGRPDGAR